MKLAPTPRFVIVAIAVVASFARVSWSQTCREKAYGVSPSVDFYAAKPGKTPHPQHMELERFYHSVIVQPGSNITLVCTAKEPTGAHWSPSGLRSYLQPRLIRWFVNSSFIRESNCDKKPRKVKRCSLSLGNIKPSDNGRYFCQAANVLGCTYKQLQLTVSSGDLNERKPEMESSKNILKKFKLKA